MMTLTGNSDEVRWRLRDCQRRYLQARACRRHFGDIWLRAKVSLPSMQAYCTGDCGRDCARANPNQCDAFERSMVGRIGWDLPYFKGRL